VTADLRIFGAVVFVRFVLPLFIPKFPLPAILACLIVDAVDQSIFSAYTHLDLTGYQSYDKALDIFYLSMAMLTTLRSWSSRPAVEIARTLFYLRLIGVAIFEKSGWRPSLLLFPNAFEYFFILYEFVRSRWNPAHRSTLFFIAAATLCWAIKLPQEYWIHIARLDLTDELKTKVLREPADANWPEAVHQHPFAGLFVIACSAALIAGTLILIQFRMGRPTHRLVLVADPIPKAIDEAHERDREIAQGWRLFDLHLLEKIILVGLVTMIFAQVLPGIRVSSGQMAVGVAVIVTVNALHRLQAARTRRSVEHVVLAFLVLALVNLILVQLAHWLLPLPWANLPRVPTLFFLLLLTLIVTLYDRWRPVFEVRFHPYGRKRRPRGASSKGKRMLEKL